MSTTPARISPVHEVLEPYGPTWTHISDCAVALHFAEPDAERETMNTLGLCDISALLKVGVKGPDIDAWFSGKNIDVPSAIYDTTALEGGGLVARVSADEVLIESGIDTKSFDALDHDLVGATPGIYRVDRQDATFLLSGNRSREVLAQTCGVNFAVAPANKLVMTRVAVVSCSILPQPIGDLPVYRMWTDYTYAPYLWETLVEIIDELGGGVIGARCHYPDMAS